MCLSVRITHLQWQSPLILMYAVMNDMHVLYVIYFMCVLFVCLYIAAHCRTPECKSVRPDWSFRPLLRFYSMSTTLWSYSMSTTPWSYSMSMYYSTLNANCKQHCNVEIFLYFSVCSSAQYSMRTHSTFATQCQFWTILYILYISVYSMCCTVLLLLKANTVEHF